MPACDHSAKSGSPKVHLKWRIIMKKFVLAAAAVLSLGASAAFAQSYSHPAPPANTHQTTVNGN